MKAVIELTAEQYEALKLENKTATLEELDYFIRAMNKGSKLEALKSLRTITNCSLKDGVSFYDKNVKYFQ